MRAGVTTLETLLLTSPRISWHHVSSRALVMLCGWMAGLNTHPERFVCGCGGAVGETRSLRTACWDCRAALPSTAARCAPCMKTRGMMRLMLLCVT